MEEVEQDKENIQPLSTGRDMNVLAESLHSTAPEGDQEKVAQRHIEAQRRQFEAELRTCLEHDDPLDTWHRYILWTEQTYPRGSSDLCSLLEKCFREFKNTTKYFDDERYLDVFIKLTRFLTPEERLSLFGTYMAGKRIGYSLARFYLAWAEYLEDIGDTKTAATVLQKGITNGAEPLDQLEQALSELDYRLAQEIFTSLESPAVEESSSIARVTFGQLITVGGRVPVNRAANVVVPTVNSQAGDSFKPQSNARWQVPELDDANEISRPNVHIPKEHDPFLGRKENEMAPGPWNNQGRLRHPAQRGRQHARALNKFQVYKDSSETEQPAHPVTHVIGSKTLTAHKPSSQPMCTSAADSDGLFWKHSSDNLPYIYIGMSEVYRGNDELSFEEIMAARWFETHHQSVLDEASAGTGGFEVFADSPTMELPDSGKRLVFRNISLEAEVASSTSTPTVAPQLLKAKTIQRNFGKSQSPIAVMSPIRELSNSDNSSLMSNTK